MRQQNSRRPAVEVIEASHETRLRPHPRNLKEQQTMANVVVVGSQWGDEGKGKNVD